LIAEDCRCHTEIKRRISMGKKKFNKRGALLRGKLKLDLKKRIVKALIWSRPGVVRLRDMDNDKGRRKQAGGI